MTVVQQTLLVIFLIACAVIIGTGAWAGWEFWRSWDDHRNRHRKHRGLEV